MALVPAVVPWPLASRHAVVPPTVMLSGPDGGVRPGLVRAAVAVPDLHLGAARGGRVRVVQALARAHAVQRAGRAAPTTAGTGAVSGRGDVRLDGGLGRGRRVAGGHDALVEGAGGAVAVVAADAQQDRAFLVHRVVAGGTRSAEEGGQAPGLRVAAQDRPLVRPALDHGGGEPVVDRRVARVLAVGVGAGVQAVLQVGHDPRAAAGAGVPVRGVAEVDRLHGAVAVVVVAGLGVAVVEAAAVVVVRAVHDVVLTLGAVPGGDAVGVVVAVADGGRGEDAVGLVPADGDGRRGGVGGVVRGVHVPAGGRHGQVVTTAGLVVDDSDDAAGTGAEGVLRGGVGVSARAQQADVERGVVRGTPHLVKRAVVRAVQRPRGGVRRHTRRSGRRVDVTRPLRSGLRRSAHRRGTGQHAENERARAAQTGEPRAACRARRPAARGRGERARLFTVAGRGRRPALRTDPESYPRACFHAVSLLYVEHDSAL